MDELELLKQAGRNEYLDPRLSRKSDPTTRKGYRLVTKLTIAGGLLVFSVIPAFAVFGIGDVVFDPTSYATLGSILTGQGTTLAKTEALVLQSVKIYENAVETFNFVQAMKVQFGSRDSWRPSLYNTVQSATTNMSGGTGAWNQAINGNPGAIDSAWANATKRIADVSFLSGSDQSSFRRANLATLNIMDSAAKACMQTTSNYRAGDQLNRAIRAIMAKLHTSDDKKLNTDMAQANLLNGAAAHQVNELAAANSFNTCQTELRLAELKMKRDEIARSLETDANSANGKVNNAVTVNPETVDPWVNGLLP